MNKIKEISSKNNPLIKRVRGLKRKKNRWESKLFIIEGITIVEEALTNQVELSHIIYSDFLLSNPKGKEFFQKIKDRDKLIKVTKEIFREISDTENPQGVLGIVGFNKNSLAEIKNLKKPSLLLLDEIQDPGNMGTIIRSGDAFNIDGIILGKGCVDPYNPKVVRATMGSIFRCPIYMCEDTKACLKFLKNLNLSVLATSLNGQALYDRDFSKGSVCIIGNEARGISEELLSVVSEEISIPMPGGAESLNAGVAASIIMYELMKKRT